MNKLMNQHGTKRESSMEACGGAKPMHGDSRVEQ